MRKTGRYLLALAAGMLMSLAGASAQTDYTFTAAEMVDGTVKGDITPNAYGATTTTKKSNRRVQHSGSVNQCICRYDSDCTGPQWSRYLQHP
ncbi:MAG: hypothetical protein IJ680_06450 [Paludibacteraceae bacterium]|nr:hypothetical protein [Paludibacteraceae bacterium]